jgi:hypothetical protein
VSRATPTKRKSASQRIGRPWSISCCTPSGTTST